MSAVRSQYSSATVTALAVGVEIPLPAPNHAGELYWLSFFDAAGDVYLCEAGTISVEGLKVVSGSPVTYGPFNLTSRPLQYLYASSSTAVRVTVLIGE